MNKTIILAKKLISIPSYLGGGVNEAEIGEFIYNYLRQFPWLTVKKEFVTKKRFNIVAFDRFPTTLLLCGHIDTVEPKEKFLRPVLKDNQLIGLGSSDMKGTLACMLSAIAKLGKTQGLMWLFYIDEEYDFLGMTQFIKDYKNKIKPKLIVGEGSDNQIRNGCRGLIEIKFGVTGKTGHASRPESGKNAIIGAQKIYLDLASEVKKFTDKLMGSSSINLASINGGLNLGSGQIGRQGNNIADFCEFIIDVRTATNRLRADTLTRVAQRTARKNNLGLRATIRHDKLGWFSPMSVLPKDVIDGYPRSQNQRTGYVDTQMLNTAFNCPCFGFGCGLGNQAHKTEEFLPIINLSRGEKFYIDLVKALKGGEK